MAGLSRWCLEGGGLNSPLGGLSPQTPLYLPLPVMGNGNTGSLSMNEGVASSNAHPTDEWNDVRIKKRKKVSKDSKSSDRSALEAGTAKKSKVDTGLFLYLKGKDFDLAKEVSRQPVEFSRKLTSIAGAVCEVKILKDSFAFSTHVIWCQIFQSHVFHSRVLRAPSIHFP